MIETVAETGSTNSDLLARAAAGAPEGLWLRAERQVAGRGRAGRAWSGIGGNLFASTIVRLRPDDPAPASLSFVAALAVHDAIAPLLPPATVQLKWPNDIMAAGAKLGGILLERAGETVVAGFGINVAAAPQVTGRRTAALAGLGASPGVTAAVLVTDLAAAFARRLARWREDSLAALLAEWQRYAHIPGERLTVTGTGGNEGPLEGRFAGLAEDGALLLALADGSVHLVRAGDVALLTDERGQEGACC